MNATGILRRTVLVTILFAGWLALRIAVTADDGPRALQPFQDGSGRVQTITTNESFDENNPFFQNLGTNGRRCSTCHLADQGWTITPARVRERFEDTAGLDAIFRTNDGSNCENADISTLERRRAAFSLLLNRGLIRMGLDVPTKTNDVPPKPAEFEIVSADDPYACPGHLSSPLFSVSLYRRPLPATNLPFLSAIMWDGREPSLAQQAIDATLGHAQGVLPGPSIEQQNAIVTFETGLMTAQTHDKNAGALAAKDAQGGPLSLARQPFYIGINDPVGLNPTGASFDPHAFALFGAWATLEGEDPVSEMRRSIARGEEIFNTKPFIISGVAGLNGQTFANPTTGSKVTVPASFSGTCTICHDSPDVGNHSVKAPLNLGLTDALRRTSDMPLYTLRNKTTGAITQVTDPGRAMITGKWADVGKFKGPILRALAARGPYFHNGFAATLDEAVEFYDTRFAIGLTAREKVDLVAFLRAL